LEAFSLLFCPRRRSYLTEFADPIYQIRNSATKSTTYLTLGDTGVLDDVMQKSGHETFVIHSHICKNVCHGKGMGYVGIATLSHLTQVTFFGEVVGSLDAIYFLWVEV
jgi:hypothetical protein